MRGLLLHPNPETASPEPGRTGASPAHHKILLFPPAASGLSEWAKSSPCTAHAGGQDAVCAHVVAPGQGAGAGLWEVGVCSGDGSGQGAGVAETQMGQLVTGATG